MIDIPATTIGEISFGQLVRNLRATLQTDHTRALQPVTPLLVPPLFGQIA